MGAERELLVACSGRSASCAPLVFFLGQIGASGNFPVYGRAGEVGQIYTSIAGLLNLLCIVNAVYTAHLRVLKEAHA